MRTSPKLSLPFRFPTKMYSICVYVLFHERKWHEGSYDTANNRFHEPHRNNSDILNIVFAVT
jgi:hypothetical protein